ncbi:response regulator [Patescibacteria group bacterium]|nr:response regulator [Patescibacteria group bacterium]
MDKKYTVLLVEDDAFLARIYATALEAQGFRLSLASNGEDGLKLVEREKPDIIILDILLPEMDGYEFLEKIKADQGSANIPVLVLSNLGQKEDVDKAMQLGASRYLIKAHALPQHVLRNINEILNIA